MKPLHGSLCLAIVVAFCSSHCSATLIRSAPIRVLRAYDPGAHGGFGTSVDIYGTTALIGATKSVYNDPNPLNSGSAYLYDVTTGNPKAKLLAPTGLLADYFGCSVAIHSDIAIVGAMANSQQVIKSGAVFFYDATTGEHLGKVKASDPHSYDKFGYSVDINEHVAIVGAQTASALGDKSGAAYLFDRNTREELFKILPFDGAENDRFGWSVAVSGTTAIVGAPYHNSYRGAAYLFDTTTGSQIAKLTAPVGYSGDLFGHSVAIDGQFALVGAKLDDTTAKDTGAAYLFDISTGELLRTLTAADASTDQAFGSSVDIDGNVAIIGAEYDDEVSSNSGAAYLFDLLTGKQISKLYPQSAEVDDWRGYSVAIHKQYALVGDYDGPEVFVYSVPEPSAYCQILILAALGTFVARWMK